MKSKAVVLAWLSLAGIGGVWFVIAALGDRVWWALPFLYGPRWIWGAALLGTFPAFAASPRKAWIPAILIALVLVFGLLNVRLGLGRLTAPKGATIRVMELNADGDRGNLHATLDAIREYNPDIMVIAECGVILKDSLARLTSFHLHTSITPLCLLSRGEILEWAERDPRGDIWKEGGSGAIVRATVATSQGPVRVGMVHLETPRDALQMYVDKSEILKQGPTTRANMALRTRESDLAVAWIDQRDGVPMVIAGDFNLPVESAIYRQHWGRFQNAFSETGFGAGFTKHTRLFGVRIDHILSSKDVEPVRSFVGKDVGSDHEPVIADFVLPTVSGRVLPGSR